MVEQSVNSSPLPAGDDHLPTLQRNTLGVWNSCCWTCASGFSVLDAILLREAPVREPKGLAWIYVATREQRPDQLSWIEYQALVSEARSFAGIIAENRQSPVVRLADRDDYPIAAEVSGDYFDVLDVRGALGDVFHSGKGRDQTPDLSDHYWKQALVSDPAIVGRAL